MIARNGTKALEAGSCRGPGVTDLFYFASGFGAGILPRISEEGVANAHRNNA